MQEAWVRTGFFWQTAGQPSAGFSPEASTGSAARRHREQAVGKRPFHGTDTLRLPMLFFVCFLQEWQPRVKYPLLRARTAVVLYTNAEWSDYRGASPR